MRDPLAVLALATGFQWDAGNDTKNWTKHSVTSAECEELFFHQPLVVQVDLAHSGREARYAALGQTSAGRRLFLVFTLRGALIRVISARPMSRREREVYRRAEVDEGQEDDQGSADA